MWTSVAPRNMGTCGTNDGKILQKFPGTCKIKFSNPHVIRNALLDIGFSALANH